MVPVPERNLTVLSGGRAAARRRVRGRLHARPRLPPRLLPARRDRVRRRRRRRPDHDHTDDRPADAAARHRRRGLARVDRRGSPAWKPERLAMTHFGVSEDVDGPAARARHPARRLGGAGPRLQRGAVHRHHPGPDRPRGRTPSWPRPTSRPRRPSSSTPGLQRYWRKRDGAARSPVAARRSFCTQSGPAAVCWRSDVADGGVAASAPGRSGGRAGRTLAGRRPQRRLQHLRPRRRDAGAESSRASPSPTATGSPTGSTTRAARSSGAGRARTPRSYWEQLDDAGLTMGPLESG